MPEANETTEELGEDTVQPYLYEPEFPSLLLDWQCWQLSSASANTENDRYWAC